MTEFKINLFHYYWSFQMIIKQQAETMQMWQPCILNEWMLSLFHSTWQVD